MDQEYNRKLLVAIPAYNEEKTIAGVIQKIPNNIAGISEVVCVVINDGSRDMTAERARSAGALVLSHERNMGVGRAFQTVLDYAINDASVSMLVNIDADGQFDPNDIPKLIGPLISGGADFVTASRFVDQKTPPINMPKIKIWGNKKVAWLISRLAGRNFNDVSCGFRAYNRRALLNLNLFGEFTYTQETFLDLSFKGLKIKEVPVTVRYFDGRESKVAKNVLVYGWRIMKIIFKTFRDFRPLLLFGGAGFFVFILGSLLDGFVLFHFVSAGEFTPYKSLAFTGAFLNAAGIGLVILGLIADMLVRMRMNQEKLLYYAKRSLKNNE